MIKFAKLCAVKLCVDKDLEKNAASNEGCQMLMKEGGIHQQMLLCGIDQQIAIQRDPTLLSLMAEAFKILAMEDTLDKAPYLFLQW